MEKSTVRNDRNRWTGTPDLPRPLLTARTAAACKRRARSPGERCGNAVHEALLAVFTHLAPQNLRSLTGQAPPRVQPRLELGSRRAEADADEVGWSCAAVDDLAVDLAGGITVRARSDQDFQVAQNRGPRRRA